jgi:hypothetical protein
MTIAATPPSIYQFRIVLRGISPLIWRRVLVHSNITLVVVSAKSEQILRRRVSNQRDE